MQRLFAKLQGKETNITIKTYDKGRKSLDKGALFFGGNSTYQPCYSAKDLEDTYNGINKELQAYLTLGANIDFEVELKGLLNGNPIDQRFQNVELFRQFLEKNSIIKSVTLEAKNEKLRA